MKPKSHVKISKFYINNKSLLHVGCCVYHTTIGMTKILPLSWV